MQRGFQNFTKKALTRATHMTSDIPKAEVSLTSSTKKVLKLEKILAVTQETANNPGDNITPNTTTANGKADTKAETDSSSMANAVNYGVKKIKEIRQNTRNNHYQQRLNSSDSSYLQNTGNFIPEKRFDFSSAKSAFNEQKALYSTKASSLDMGSFLRIASLYTSLENENIEKLYKTQQKYYRGFKLSESQETKTLGDAIDNNEVTYHDVEKVLAIQAKNAINDTYICKASNSNELRQIMKDGDFRSSTIQGLGTDIVTAHLSTERDGTFKSKHTSINNEQSTNEISDHLDPRAASNSSELGDDPDIVIFFKKHIVGKFTTITMGKIDDCEDHQKGIVQYEAPTGSLFPTEGPFPESGTSPFKFESIQDSPEAIQAQILGEYLKLDHIEKIRFLKPSAATKDSSLIDQLKAHHILVEIEDKKNQSIEDIAYGEYEL